MIGIWDSREMCDRFRDERLSKILESLTCGTRIQPTYRELQIAHLISAATVPANATDRKGNR